MRSYTLLFKFLNYSVIQFLHGFRNYLVLLFIGCCFVTSGQNIWTQKASIIPPARAHAVGFSLGNKGYLAGGMTNLAPPFVYLQDFQEFDPVTNNWVQKTELPHKIAAGISFTIGPKAYITTGYDSGYNRVSDMFVWDTIQNSWSVNQNIPQEIRRSNALGFSIGEKGYVAMGYGSGYGGAYGVQKDIWEYDPINNTWTRKADFPGAPRADAACFVIGDKAYVTTGYPAPGDKGDTIPTNDLWEFDPVADTWVQKATFPGGIMRNGAVGFSIGNRGYIVTGMGTDFLLYYTDYWENDVQQDTWTSMGRFPGNIRAFAAGFQMLNTGYIVSGWFLDFPNWTDVWEYYVSPVGIIDKDDLGVTFSPNPFQHKLNFMIKDPLTGNLSLIITDLVGRVVFKDNVIKNEFLLEKTYDLQNLRRGVYIYCVTSNNGIVVLGKVIKV